MPLNDGRRVKIMSARINVEQSQCKQSQNVSTCCWLGGESSDLETSVVHAIHVCLGEWRGDFQSQIFQTCLICLRFQIPKAMREENIQSQCHAAPAELLSHSGFRLCSLFRHAPGFTETAQFQTRCLVSTPKLVQWEYFRQILKQSLRWWKFEFRKRL